MKIQGQHHRGRRRGQTLAEFALTMPILLMLLFGIIEFGRIFQAWVTLQNSARAAARYASTGQWDETRYPMITGYEAAANLEDVNSIVPCVSNTSTTYPASSQRGTLNTSFYPNDSGDPNDRIYIYQGGIESIYSTWYGGDDCDPANPADQDRRKDMARILSIMDEARRGAAGLALGPENVPRPTLGDTGTNPENVPWYQVWYRPLPGDADNNPLTPPERLFLRNSNQPGWFDTMICSTRTKVEIANQPLPGLRARRYSSYPPDTDQIDPSAPVCRLREYPIAGGALANAGWTNNAGRPWLDAGGPGDTVTVVVTFNHPLVTPLGLASYVQLQARRTAVNESFRAPIANDLIGEIPPDAGPVNTPTPTLTPSNTLVPSNTPTQTNTPEPSFTPSRTNTSTATSTFTATPVFTCSFVSIRSGSFVLGSNSVSFSVQNTYQLPMVLRRFTLVWPTNASYPDMGVGSMSLGGSPVWAGYDTNPSTDVGASDVGAADGSFAGGANLLIPPGTMQISATFFNNPGPLNTILSPSSFTNTRVVLRFVSDLGNNTDCPLDLIPPTSTPVVIQPSNTPTPDCVPGLLAASAPSAQQFGIVQFNLTNYRNVAAVMTGFRLNWARPAGNTTMVLYEVRGGGSTFNNSLVLWQANATNQDANPPTIGGTGAGTADAIGTWQRNLTIPPFGSTMPIFVLFRNAWTTGSAAAFGFDLVSMNGSAFAFTIPICATPGGGGPGGTVPAETIVPPSNTPTRTNTATRTPTFTASATRTASRTPTPSNTVPSPTPSNTQPATATRTPSVTPSRTLTQTRTPLPTACGGSSDTSGGC